MKGSSITATFTQFIHELQAEEAPISHALIGVITAVFIIEAGLARIYGVGQIQTFATGLFGVHPTVAWIAAPVLHRGFLHLAASVLTLAILGPAVERHWGRWRYFLFLLGSGYLSIAGGAASIRAFTTAQFAFYGTSGVVFALGGFAIIHLQWSHYQMTRVERSAAFLGAIAFISVVFDPVTGPYFHPSWVNGGHLSGFLIGGLAAHFRCSDCSIGN